MLSVIKTEKQYEINLKRIFDLMQKDLKPNSKESDELESLSILVKDYENKFYPISELIPSDSKESRASEGKANNEI